VRMWKTKVYQGKRGNSYYVRWTVAGKEWKEPFKHSALAESFRSDLVAAARKGEAFDTESGRPVSMARTTNEMGWYEFACKFVDMKWPRVAATTRRTHAEALTALTPAMFTTTRGKPSDKLIRAALCRWAFNTAKRGHEDCPGEIRAALAWVERNTRPVSALMKPEVLRPMLDSLTVRLDGKPAASSVVSRRRKILNTSAEFAVERGLLLANPIPALKWKAPRAVQVVDPRCVPNPIQVRALFDGVREQGRVGRRLVAYYGCLYYAGMRPEEAAHLNKSNLTIPTDGWGDIHLDGAEPYAGKEWTDSGQDRDRRQLKQRERGESRAAPCPPELTALLHAHLDEFGTTPDGQLFVGDRNHDELPKTPSSESGAAHGRRRSRRRSSPRLWRNGRIWPVPTGHKDTTPSHHPRSSEATSKQLMNDSILWCPRPDTSQICSPTGRLTITANLPLDLRID